MYERKRERQRKDGSFLKMGQIRPLFVLGSRTQGGRMGGADELTELWRQPQKMVVSFDKLGVCLRERQCEI